MNAAMIDSRYETPRSYFPDLEHRAYIGGLWDELGQFQIDFLRDHGLQPHHRLLDVGCGSLRGGIRFIEYLEPLRYHGTDINPVLISAGVHRELTRAQRAKVRPESFIVSEDFQIGFDVADFDYGLAMSLFTHLSMNKIILCLQQVRPKFDGGKFYATFFRSENLRLTDPQVQAGGITTYGWTDPFHYSLQDIEYMAKRAGWSVRWIGECGHPRGQQMAEFS